MIKLIDHLPPEIVESQEFTEAKKFLQILDAMQDIRQAELDKYTNFANLALASRSTIERVLAEFGAEYYSHSDRATVEELALKGYEVTSKKGTLVGLTQYLKILTKATSVSYTTPEPYQLLAFTDDIETSVLPEGADIYNELSGSYSPPIYCRTILSDWAVFKAPFQVVITNSVSSSAGFKEALKIYIRNYMSIDSTSNEIQITFI